MVLSNQKTLTVGRLTKGMYKMLKYCKWEDNNIFGSSPNLNTNFTRNS